MPKKKNKPVRATVKAKAKVVAVKRRRPKDIPLSAEDARELREELEAARTELSRIASAENSAKRELEARRSGLSSAETNIRAELEAVRLDLKTALAELEIARAEIARSDGKLQHAQRTEVEATESARQALHVSENFRDQTHSMKTDLERVRAEYEQLRQKHEELQTECVRLRQEDEEGTETSGSGSSRDRTKN